MNKTFDAAKHEYSVDGRSLPSVTTILRATGFIDGQFFNDYAMTRGSFVHKACELLDLDELDEQKIDQAIEGYLTAYKKFRSEVNVEWTEIERPLFSVEKGYAGTPDRVSGESAFSIFDIKTGLPQPWHKFQLAAYAALKSERPKDVNRYGLYLRKDGTYRLENYRDRRDVDVWNAALTVYHAQRGS